MGVSGGEEGARHGPSMMPGGDRDGYDDMAPILTKIAAQVEDGPCVTYCGPGGAGHYVKMVHNGIEYGDMQLIAEAYDVLRSAGRALATPSWRRSSTNGTRASCSRSSSRSPRTSSARRIRTGQRPRRSDPRRGRQKGTGKWTVQDAAELGAPVPTIAASVDARVLSSDRAARLEASELLRGPSAIALSPSDRKAFIDDVRARALRGEGLRATRRA